MNLSLEQEILAHLFRRNDELKKVTDHISQLQEVADRLQATNEGLSKELEACRKELAGALELLQRPCPTPEVVGCDLDSLPL